jgi:hypothetical protein
MNCTLGGKPIHDPPPDYKLPINFFAMKTGAANYGSGQFLMSQTDYNSIQNANPSGIVNLVLESSASAGGDTSQGITLPVLLAGWAFFSAPLSNSSGSPSTSQWSNSSGSWVSTTAAMVIVMVFDRRVLLTQTVNQSFNVQQSPITGTNFYSTTLDGGSQYTWAEVITALSAPSLPANPSWNPRNLIYDGMTQAKVWDDIANRLYLVSGYDWNVSGTVKFYAPGSSSGNNSSVGPYAAPFKDLGGKWTRNPNRMPTAIDVVFRLISQDPSNPFPSSGSSGRQFIVAVSNSSSSSGSAGFTLPLSIGDYVGIYTSSGGVTNSSELTTVANDMGARALAAMQADLGEQRYIGIWPFDLDGEIRGIIWQFARDGGTTTVYYSDKRDYYFDLELARAVDTVSNELIVSGGTSQVVAGPNGQRMLYTSEGQRVGVCNVSQTGGSAGTNGSAYCTYSYNATALSGGTVLGTNAIPKGYRPLQVQTTAGHLGLYYYDGSNTFQLAAVIDEVWEGFSCSS